MRLPGLDKLDQRPTVIPASARMPAVPIAMQVIREYARLAAQRVLNWRSDRSVAAVGSTSANG